jgi:ligand-binding sensor domain-containing protein
LPDDQVRCLFVESDSVIWIGTFEGGVSRLSHGQFTTFATSNSPLPDDYVRAVALDRQGFYWFATAGGLTRFDGNAWTVYNQSNSVLGSNNIKTLLVARDSSLWIGTINGGLTHVVDTTWATFKTTNSQISDNTILSLAEDSVGRIWMGTAANGLCVFDGLQFVSFTEFNSAIPSSTVNDVLANDSSLLLATMDAGLVGFDEQNFVSWNTTNSAIPSNDVSALGTDGNNLWLTTPGSGVALASPPVGQPEVENLLKVFPNPTNGVVMVFGIYRTDEIAVFDLLMQEIAVSGRVAGDAVLLDFRPWPNGTYWIRVGTDPHRMHYSLVIRG